MEHLITDGNSRKADVFNYFGSFLGTVNIPCKLNTLVFLPNAVSGDISLGTVDVVGVETYEGFEVVTRWRLWKSK